MEIGNYNNRYKNIVSIFFKDCQVSTDNKLLEFYIFLSIQTEKLDVGIFLLLRKFSKYSKNSKNSKKKWRPTDSNSKNQNLQRMTNQTFLICSRSVFPVTRICSKKGVGFDFFLTGIFSIWKFSSSSRI